LDETSRSKLWDDYSRTKSTQIRETLIIEYSPLVKVVAGRMSMYLGYNVEYEELVSYGIFGLIDAIDKYDNNKNVKFETYASLRIRGSILDQMRKLDWLPRSLRQKQKLIDNAIMKLESEKGTTATDEEIAKELDIDVEELNNWQGQTKASGILSLDEYTESGSDVKMDTTHNSAFEQPEKAMEKKELKAMLVEALTELTDKEKQVVTFYYYEEMTLKEIASVLEVSESRVSQLHTKALGKMRKKLGSYMNLLEV